MAGRAREFSMATSIVVTAAFGLGLALYWVNKRRFPRHSKLGSLSWLKTKVLLRCKQIIVVNSREECSAAINKLMSECRDHRYLGFDCEWLPQRMRRTKGQHPVALLQLATPGGTCALFRLCNIGFVPEEIKAILRDPTLLKVGVAPIDDARLLLRDYGAQVHGCVDLRLLLQSQTSSTSPSQSESRSKQSKVLNSLSTLLSFKEKSTKNTPPEIKSNIPTCDYDSTLLQSEPVSCESSQSVNQSQSRVGQLNQSQSRVGQLNQPGGGPGLARMAHSVLGVELDKNWRVRCSDWEAKILSQKQVVYAANDALVSALIFARVTDLSTTWWPPWQVRKPTPTWSQVHLRCVPLLDVRPTSKPAPAGVRKMFVRPFNPNSRAFSTLKSPLYDNCFLQAPDGDVLCTCDRKKAEWYVTKGLAEVLESSPESLVIRLKFEPSGRGGVTRKFYTLLRQNVCVVCGAEKCHIKKSVVPKEYRTHFPADLKDHQSHDVLLLCVACNHQANCAQLSLRQQLAEICHAPLSSHTQASILNVPSLIKVRSAGRALLSSAHQLPAERTRELRGIIATHFQVEEGEVGEQLIQQATSVDARVDNSANYQPHGLCVVRHFQRLHGDDQAGIFELEKIWRQHFLDIMQPRFLPELWSVDHRQYT